MMSFDANASAAAAGLWNNADATEVNAKSILG